MAGAKAGPDATIDHSVTISSALEEAHPGTSTMELFFDLVFVFTISQVALIVEHDPGWRSGAQAVVELVVIYWMYGGYVWLANQMRVSPFRHRFVLLTGMALLLLVSLSVPRAFGDDSIAFGLAYLGLTVAHLCSFLIFTQGATVTAMIGVGAANLVGCALILGAGFVDNGPRWPYWVTAILVQWLVPAALGQHRSFAIAAGHFAERHGLMILIVLGESLVSFAVAAQELPVTWTLAGGTLSGLLAIAAMWWIYFGSDDHAAAEAMAALPPAERGLVALFGYGVSHVMMLVGVIFLAAATSCRCPISPNRPGARPQYFWPSGRRFTWLAKRRFALGWASIVALYALWLGCYSWRRCRSAPDSVQRSNPLRLQLSCVSF